jgi:hypothetical protein
MLISLIGPGHVDLRPCNDNIQGSKGHADTESGTALAKDSLSGRYDTYALDSLH